MEALRVGYFSHLSPDRLLLPFTYLHFAPKHDKVRTHLHFAPKHHDKVRAHPESNSRLRRLSLMEPRAKKSQNDDDSFCAEHSQVEANVEDEGDSWGVCSESAEAENEITPVNLSTFLQNLHGGVEGGLLQSPFS